VIPYNPFWAMYHFITRDTISDGVYGANQRITREEALRMYTINNARLTFEESIKGSLEPGKLADLVDPLRGFPHRAGERHPVDQAARDDGRRPLRLRGAAGRARAGRR
jgi:cytosine/adenosine deaminase-related metal-dependent hydrolase